MAKKSKKKKGDRLTIQLACTLCNRKNYSTTKNKKNDGSRIELNKYCSVCKKITLHKESK